MSLILNTYFSKDINLTGAQINVVASAWLNEYEEDILKKLLGYTLYKALIADLNGTSEPTLQRFKELIDGADLTFTTINGYEVITRWVGLRNKTLLKSLIAYYVYYQYRNEEESFNSGSGQKSGLAENSESVSAAPKLINTWNKMVDWYGKIPTNIAYPEYFLNQNNYRHFNPDASAFNFLLANIDTYPEWVFEPLDTINIFGI